MKREDLFLAIGEMEEYRLARSEMRLSSGTETVDADQNRKRKRILRNFLIAVAIISTLAVSAFAVGSFLIFDSPEEMITAIFGDETGFDNKGITLIENPGKPDSPIENPAYDRVPVDEPVMQEDVAPYVNPVGQSIAFMGYTLTVDAIMYDNGTRCGFVTYLLENPNGLPEYKLQPSGEIWYEGMPDPVNINQYGYAYIIQEKTTDTCLAATYYFQWEERRAEDLVITLQPQQTRYTPDEFDTLIKPEVEKRKQQTSKEEIIASAQQMFGAEVFEKVFQGMEEEAIAEQCYWDIVAREVARRLEEEGTSEAITIALKELRPLKHITAGQGSVMVSPVAMRIDITDLAFLHTDSQGRNRVDCDNIDSVEICFADGTQYTVSADGIHNAVFSVTDVPEENVQTEVFVSPEEDPNGEGFIYVKNSHGYVLLTMMFNRLIDVDEVSAVALNGVELPAD